MAFPVIRLHESTNRQEFMVNILVMWCGSEPVVCWLGIHIICDGSVNVKREDMYIYTRVLHIPFSSLYFHCRRSKYVVSQRTNTFDTITATRTALQQHKKMLYFIST